MSNPKGLRNSIEEGYTKLGYSIFKRGRLVFFSLLVLQVFLVLQIFNLKIDTSTEGMLREDDLELVRYNEFREEFGRDDLLMITVKSERSLVNPRGIGIISDLHRSLVEGVSFIDEANSLINARDIRGVDGYLVVDDLFAEYPRDEAAWAQMAEKVRRDPMFSNFLISRDGTLGVVLLRTLALIPDVPSGEDSDAEELTDLGGFDEFEPSGSSHFITDAENSRMIREVESVLEAFKAGNSEGGEAFSFVGTPAMTEILKRKMIRSIITFMILVVLVILVLLALLFRQPAGIVLPLMIGGFSISGTLGIMALAGVSLKIPTQILPSFLVSVSIGASIHVLTIFFRYFSRGESRKDAVARALGHSGLAVTMTSLTTIGGLLSFAGSKVAPIADLGIFASLGVLLSLVYTTVLLPGVLSFFPVKPQGTTGASLSIRGDRFLKGIADFSCRRAGTITVVSILILFLFLGLSFRIVFGHNILSWLPEKMEYLKTSVMVDREMGGSSTFEILVDTRRENGIYTPGFLSLLDNIEVPLGEAAEKEGLYIGKTLSVADLLKETHQALNGDDPVFYTTPPTKEAAAQELLLFENSGSDDLTRLTDPVYTKARITVKLPWADGLIYGRFLERVEAKLSGYFPDSKVTITGLVPLLARTVTAVIISTKQSYILAYLVIAGLMLLLIGDFKLGLISMLPNLFPIILTLGIMGIFGIVLDMFTMLIGSIAMGLAVDDTIHFMHNYRRIYSRTGDSDRAVRETLLGTGRAMLSTTVALTAGFFVFTFAEMRNLHYFGLLTGITLITALAADFLLAPALVTLLARGKGEKKK